MVDPINFTNFNRTPAELEEVALFSVLVAGKNAVSTAKALDRFLGDTKAPFAFVRKIPLEKLPAILKSVGIGCYERKALYLHHLVHSGVDLKTCTEDDLVAMPGIKYKTANMFLMHTRQGYRGGCLDTHILKYLRDLGHKVPKSTPQSRKRYREIQDIYFKIAESLGVDPTTLDLEVWRKYSGHAA